MAKLKLKAWRWQKRLAAVAHHIVQCGLLMGALSGLSALAQPAAEPSPAASIASAPTGAGPAASAAAPQPPAIRVGRIRGRITAEDLGVVINTADPYSVAVGEYYVRRRGIAPENVVRLSLPVRARLTAAEFEAFNDALHAQMPAGVQGLALAWREPYAVECNSITSAIALGFQPRLCEQTCAPSRTSLYFNYPGARPYTELGLWPSMLLAARNVAAAEALIERGIASDGSQPSEAGANAWFVSTPDGARSVRAALFPPAGRLGQLNLDVKRASSQDLPPLKRTLVYETGLTRVDGLTAVDWLPGALADHLTSFGGLLDAPVTGGQMSAVDWLEAGATASYGTVTEPCNHLQKFPHPQVLLLYYAQGSTALEAYWRSVAWPGQGVFIGEPLAAPFAARKQND
ncbi:TIGR03790 family protein [Paucibacter sp. R3-3]|uniref:TIGR03790 family protein n=1 Tax=Roseateles agri TaxID=3098619 RepID=A0ABU5DMS8_9BURK|nr:TIGR03790 family protein [Paucibacter sp. R3-3]MDY0747033.1 TIGR03790 family protein [Paucibacter sp. R3-3]